MTLGAFSLEMGWEGGGIVILACMGTIKLGRVDIVERRRQMSLHWWWSSKGACLRSRPRDLVGLSDSRSFRTGDSHECSTLISAGL